MSYPCFVIIRQADESLFVDADARNYPLWAPYPWVPSSAYGKVKPGHDGQFRASCLPDWDNDDEAELCLTEDMLRVSGGCASGR